MNSNERSYKEKFRNFFSDDEIEIHSVDELREKLKRRQLLFPNAQVNDFIKANLKIDGVLKDKNVKTSLSKEEQKKILRDAPKDVGEEWDRTSLAKSCRTPSIKKAVLKSRKLSSKSESKIIKDTEESDKNYHYIKSILVTLKGRQRGKEPFDFENDKVFNEVRNKETELTESESELINEYKKYRQRVSNRRTSKERYLKRSELPKEKLEEIRRKEKEYKKIYIKKNQNKINFKNRFRFYVLSEEGKEKVRKYRREKVKEWREKHPDEYKERYIKWCKENKEALRAAERKRYREMSEEQRQKLLARKKEWREKNKEKIKGYRKKYVQENREKIAETMRMFRKSNPESIRTTMKKYYEKNKEVLKAKTIARRAAKRERDRDLLNKENNEDNKQ